MMSASALLSPVSGIADTEELLALLLLNGKRYNFDFIQILSYCDLAILAVEVVDDKTVLDVLN